MFGNGGKVMNILFICTGNTCRSPMAEAILKHKQPTINVKSAGLYANQNDRANPLTLQILRENNIQIDHYSQAVTDELLKWADYIFTMTQAHKQLLLLYHPKYEDKYFVLKEFTIDSNQNTPKNINAINEKSEDEETELEQQDEYEQVSKGTSGSDLESVYDLQNKMENIDISDPFGGNIDTYKKTYDELEQIIEQLIKIIQSEGEEIEGGK